MWRLTQTPELHECWDLRFSTITYLPRTNESHAQRFRYATRIGFGLKIEGEGETTGNRESTTGVRTSSLRFWSDEGPVAFAFPMLLSGIADVREWYDDALGKYRIEVNVTNPTWGPLFGDRGSFDVEWRTVRADEVPRDVRPVREERRE